MAQSSCSALVTDQGSQVLLRLDGQFYKLSQEELRTVLDLSNGPPGLGITIDRDRLQFEFVGDAQTAVITASQLHRRIAS